MGFTTYLWFHWSTPFLFPATTPLVAIAQPHPGAIEKNGESYASKHPCPSSRDEPGTQGVSVERKWGVGSNREGRTGATSEGEAGTKEAKNQATRHIQNRRYTPLTIGCTGFEGCETGVRNRKTRADDDRDTAVVNVRNPAMRALESRNKGIAEREYRAAADIEGVVVHP
ncbi:MULTISPECIES: hypothetical protein [Haloferax]|uniref:Uncharacterized protein n=2 Tax=Haloferax TaxID=2251 RepID=A0A6G1YYM4_9EURY|nr:MULTISPECIES: hypothetical protein [Haloferax]KAB1186623.1 hypothetical protein Hfx1149_00685 [Haloferax sp. CBA1149]MRW79241.1 hypothetical protein [Haloferax marinisediminis]